MSILDFDKRQWMSLAFGAIGLVIGLYGFREWRLANASQNWPSTTGAITQSESDFDADGGWHFNVKFSYVVGGRTYTGTRVRYGRIGTGRRSVERLERRYPVDRSVDVFYNPDDPSLSALERGSTVPLGAVVALLMAVAFLGVAVVNFVPGADARASAVANKVFGSLASIGEAALAILDRAPAQASVRAGPPDAEVFARLARRTRRNPLINTPQVLNLGDRTLIRRNHRRMLLPLLFLGVVGCGMAVGGYQQFQFEDPSQYRRTVGGTLLGVSACLLCLAAWSVLWQGLVAWDRDSDSLMVRYGCSLFPRWIQLDKPLNVALQRGHDAGVIWKNHSVVSLTQGNHDGPAFHLAYAQSSDTTLATYHELAGFVDGECTNNLTFKVMLPSGRWIKLVRQATWQAGRGHYRRNIVHFRSPRVATIEQELTRFGDAHEPRPYVSRLELRDDAIAFEYSDGRTENIRQSECLALQICKEDWTMRYSRYEINLVLRSPRGKRVNLVSYDSPPDEEPADIYDTAEQITAMFDLQTMDHI